jgi:hypothetical protein
MNLPVPLNIINLPFPSNKEFQLGKMGFFAEWRDFIGNFLAGAFAGGFSVTASHPFEYGGNSTECGVFIARST